MTAASAASLQRWIGARNCRCASALTEAVAGGVGEAIVDFAEVAFLGAAPLGPLATTATRPAQNGCRLIVGWAPPLVARVLALTGLEHLLRAR